MRLNHKKHQKQVDVQSIDKERMIEELVDTLGTHILRLAFTYVKDKKIAEDITQEVFLKCFQKWDQFRGDSNIKTWVYSITINLCKDYLKSWSFRNLLFYDFTTRQDGFGENALDLLLEKSQKKRLATHVLNLPIKYREVLILFYYEDYSIEEISTFLNTNENTLRTRLRRAKELLKKAYLKEKRDEYGQ
ncbi:sigma-70 family RNA polymerase sigma factor [Cytobacillus sp. FJAT-54145]|uniref:Sigma-70 family RNA polymerase sigma factor n=1 Tax=Cytobacillus spartinae TaxID=3299023 RepID=A0ABW6K897_9BACI